jgi:pyrroloquinoline quinone biosynthesis protein D
VTVLLPDETAVPALAAGVKFRFDRIRQAWVILAPERLFLPDDQATAILHLMNGVTTLDAIIDDIAGRFDAPRAIIAADVIIMLQDLAAKGVVKW